MLKHRDSTFCGLFILLFIVFSYAIADADEIVLENGNTLTGKVIKAEKGTLTISTPFSEPIKVNTSAIRRISTDGEISIHLANGEVLKGRLAMNERSEIVVESSDGRSPAVISWDKVKSINPPPRRWTGNISIGANKQSGNTDRTAASIGAEGTRRTEDDRASFRFLFNYAEESGQVTERNTYGALKYDHFFSEKHYAYLAVEMLSDKFKDLSLRTIVGPGVGYQIIDEPSKSLSAEFGLAYFSEDHIVAEDDSWISARLAGTLKWLLADTVTFTDHLALYGRVDKLSNYNLRNEASLSSALSSSWALKLSNIIDYSGKPAPGIKKADVQWILAMQYGF